MPSATFFHLPPEKREKLLVAARDEFARVPFAETSISRIIQAAGIPRGSFYMYFSDKEDLFFHLMERYAQAMEEQIGLHLDRTGGEPFSALLAFYDDTRAWKLTRDQSRTVRELMDILRLNRYMHAELFLRGAGPERAAARLARRVDPALLDLQEPQDLEQMMDILIKVTAGAVVSGTASGEDGAVRKRLASQLDILRRGMAAERSGA